MSYYYPYPSSLLADIKSWRKGRDFIIWQDDPPVEKRLAHIGGPIIEIGGPSDMGFYFLDGIALPVKPLITNMSNNPLPYAENAIELAGQVDEIIDARKMPFVDDSIGTFLMAAMSLSSDWWINLSETEKDRAEAKIDEEFDRAKMEMGLVATGILAPSKAAYAQRVQIYREVHRTLKIGGLFFADGSLEDIVILKHLGFKLAAFLQYQDQGIDGWQNLSYEFVVRK
jgi:hypothetical protein